jgi:Pel9A-like, right handed beta helix region
LSENFFDMFKFNLLILIIFSTTLFAQIFVAPNGDDNNLGTIDFPLRTLTKAISLSGPDSLIYMRGGVYFDSTTVQLNKNGLEDHYIKIWAYQNEIPVIDFSGQPVVTTSRGLQISKDFWYLKGLTIINAKDNGIHISGSNNIVENCVLNNCNDTGLQISNGGSYNAILNCDSYLNHDPLTNGENADGFAAKLGIGPGNVFKGCRSWNNSDDGYDTYEAADTVIIDNCWAFRNGYNIWGIQNFSGDGNGFKLGGNYFADPHKIIRSVAFDNVAKGFDQNNNTAGITLYNNTAWGNGSKNFSFPTTPDSGFHKLKNNISFDGDISIENTAIQEANSWQGFTVTTADFKSLDSTLAIASRNEDGSLPEIDLLRLATGSPLIDSGVWVGLPFNDVAPDLGAFESDGIPNNVEENQFANSFLLEQNYPNPFNPGTIINYFIPESGIVKLEIFNIIGEKIEGLVDEYQSSGFHKIYWDAGSQNLSLPSGIYLVKLQWNDYIKSIKILFLK